MPPRISLVPCISGISCFSILKRQPCYAASKLRLLPASPFTAVPHSALLRLREQNDSPKIRGRAADAGAEPPPCEMGGWLTEAASGWRSPALGLQRPRGHGAFLSTDRGREEKHLSVTHGIRDWPEHYRNPLLHIYKRTSLTPKAEELHFILTRSFFFFFSLGKFQRHFPQYQMETTVWKILFDFCSLFCPSIANFGRNKVNGWEKLVGCVSESV